MKKFFTLIILVAGTQLAIAQEHDHSHDAPGAHAVEKVVPETIAFTQLEHDFGKIPQGKPVTYDFEFKNAGNTGLKLDNVQASCGCTTPEWTREEVAAGQGSKITVGYNAAAEGPFAKTITVTYNGGASKILTIKGEVWKTPATSAPENSSLNNIKN